MRPPRALWAILLLIAPGAVAAEPIGEHVLRSYWDAGRRTIYSDVLRVHADGLVEERKVVGGTVDGISMIQIAHYGPGVSKVRGPFVPTIGEMDGRLRWQTSCVFVTPDSAGSNDVPGDREIEALAASLDEWTSKTASCSYMRFMLQPAQPLEVGLDGKNTLKFREQTWCRPESEHKPAECYESEASAITTLCYINDARRADNGTVLDADVEVNSVDYAIAVGCETQCQTAGTGTIADLQNTLTHEYGHVLGLDHTCWEGSPASAPRTHDGSPAPQCFPEGDLAPQVVAATMYNFQGPRETQKRTVEADDIAGICDTYPIAENPDLCEPVDPNLEDGCGCAAGRAGGRSGLLWLLFAAAWIVRRFRAPHPPRT